MLWYLTHGLCYGKNPSQADQKLETSKTSPGNGTDSATINIKQELGICMKMKVCIQMSCSTPRYLEKMASGMSVKEWISDIQGSSLSFLFQRARRPQALD